MCCLCAPVSQRPGYGYTTYYHPQITLVSYVRPCHINLHFSECKTFIPVHETSVSTTVATLTIIIVAGYVCALLTTPGSPVLFRFRIQTIRFGTEFGN